MAATPTSSSSTISDNNVEVDPRIQKQLDSLVTRFDSLQSLFVSTSEGVPLAKATNPTNPSKIDLTPAETLLPGLLSVTAEQAGKLKFGQLKTVTNFFESCVLINVHCSPLVLTLIGDTSDVGELLSYANSLVPVFEPMRVAVETLDLANAA